MSARLANAVRVMASLGLLCATPAGWAGAPAPTREGAGPRAAAPVMEEHPLGDLPADDPRMEAYSHGNYILGVVDFMWSAGLLALIACSGFGATLQAWAGKAARGPNLKVAMYVALFTLVLFAGSLPLAVYSGFVRERRFGFANQEFAAWLGDRGKALLVAVVVQTLCCMVLYAAIRRLGRRWWVAGAGLAMVFLVIALAVAPVFIAPLFNTFAPLEDGPLRTDILAMARAEGIPAEEVFAVDASRQSSHNNAYVAGLLGTQRIVLYDTLLKQFTPREIKVVMGHEMGHYVLNHIWRFVAFLSLFVLPGFFLMDRVSRRIIEGRPAWGIASLSEPASLPVLLLVLNISLFLAGPALYTFSRFQEHQADVFGLDATRDPVAGASAFLKFGRLDLGEYHVHPWTEALLFSHPSLGNRVRFAQEYARRHGVTEETPAAGTAP